MNNFLSDLVNVDMFALDAEGKWKTGEEIGAPFVLTYTRADVLVSDFHKNKIGGLAQGSFLLAYYTNKLDKAPPEEAILLRVVKPVSLLNEKDIIASMVEYYKKGTTDHLDPYTLHEFQFSGVECRVLGTFFKDSGKLRFGADVENFYSPHNYRVIAPNKEVLEFVVNYLDGRPPGSSGSVPIGRLRYSSSDRIGKNTNQIPIYVRSTDLAGKRTALFGMTRTGKSNTIKTIVHTVVNMGKKAPHKFTDADKLSAADAIKPFGDDDVPRFPIGQIIFDMNGEYANANLQDQGTAIFDLYKDDTVRYSTIEKQGFKVLKANFHKEIQAGFEIIKNHATLEKENSDYFKNFKSIDFTPADLADKSASDRYAKKVSIYRCILHRAGFKATGALERVKFAINKDLMAALADKANDPSGGIPINAAAILWDAIWDLYIEKNKFFADYEKKKEKEYLDEDMKALLTVLTGKTKDGVARNGFIKLRPIAELHTNNEQESFDIDILKSLRSGKIVILDLSLGDPGIQQLFAERICRVILQDAMKRFTEAKANNFIQFYFEEAHNLFPRKDDQDLTNIYNRIAKEGAKLHLGLVYATQEVSSISSNILKNTQNFFIAHLNNEDETRELRKYYDFSDFTESLLKFSQDTDKGFVRVKTYSSPFIVPVQINKFPPEKK